MFTAQEIIELVKAGVSPAEIVEMQRASSAAGAESTVAAPPREKPAVPAWIVQHAQNKAARRALAATLRESDPTIDFSTPKGQATWRKAKKQAGLA